MTAPILTIRGREIREPTLWAIGGVLVFLTPLPSVLGLPLLMAWWITESVQAIVILLLATLGLLTWWAVSRPNRVSVRAWSVGMWLTAWIVTLFIGIVLLGSIERVVPLIDWVWEIIAAGFGLGLLFVASPFFARASFILGQRWFVERHRPTTPTELSTTF